MSTLRQNLTLNGSPELRRAGYILRSDVPGIYQLSALGLNGHIVGQIERFAPRDWIMTGWWAPAPEDNLRGYEAAHALDEACRRQQIDLDAVEGADLDSTVLISDARGIRRMGAYDPKASIAANE